jgi:hypothetical protein
MTGEELPADSLSGIGWRDNGVKFSVESGALLQ